MHLTARFGTAKQTLHFVQMAAEGAQVSGFPLPFISSHHILASPSLGSGSGKNLEPSQAEIQVRNSLNSPLHQISPPHSPPQNAL